MQKVTLTDHNIRRVFQRLMEVYTPLKRGQEDAYSPHFLSIESNMLKMHRRDSSLNSRRAKEAVDLCLVSINGYLSDLEYDCSAIANPANLALMVAALLSCPP